MKYFVKFHSLEWFEDNPDISIDDVGDCLHLHYNYYVFKDDIGKIVNILDEEYLDDYESGIKELDWAIEEVLTKEINPEYYL